MWSHWRFPDVEGSGHLYAVIRRKHLLPRLGGQLSKQAARQSDPCLCCVAILDRKTTVLTGSIFESFTMYARSPAAAGVHAAQQFRGPRRLLVSHTHAVPRTPCSILMHSGHT